MKKLSVLLSFVLLFNSVSFKADEGMFLVHLLGEKVYANMVKRGLKMTKEQLYSANTNSLKDAILLFGRGCTAEIVSKEGLVFTNHHCGYEAIAAASSTSHNYLRDGFWAKSKGEEIPSKGLTVQFLVKIEDVTAKVEEAIKNIPPNEISSKLNGILMEMSKKASEGSEYEVRINSFFKGNQFLQFTYQRYKDIRLVGTPPESIGKFGGDTDNWEWPRHTGDFSVFRIYMGKDGKPAEYSKDNVPFIPKRHLAVSLKGIKDGDFAMVFGYPGSTNRYETSYGVKLKVEIDNPSIVNLRDVRLKCMFAEMIKDPAVKIQIGSNYASIANYWKFFDGEAKQLTKLKVYEQKQKDEAAFEVWAKGKPEYDNLFKNFADAYEMWTPFAKHRMYIMEGINGSPLISFAASLKQLEQTLANEKSTDEQKNKLIAAVKSAHDHFMESENIKSDECILSAVLKMFYKDIPASQKPNEFFTKLEADYGKLDWEETYEKFAKNVFEKTIFLNKDKWNEFIANPSVSALKSDPAYAVASSFNDNYFDNYNKYFNEFNAQKYLLEHKYLKGVNEMKKGQAIYPDANQTMRVSYGTVGSYSPRDGVKYDYVTTLRGLKEKYKPGDYEFDAPAKLMELIEKKDYGQYIDKVHNDIVVGFITSNDITGGNSGSPIMNAKGELIGLCFDGNYEALGHKIALDKNLTRTINVDIRFVLFVIDKLGGATNIINELTLVRQ
ncbi:MAG: S46 family peptidase [Sphingobacteriaceae bacterium]|nr:S46 family peptidase [Sphingobacteriaceae bacterium]